MKSKSTAYKELIASGTLVPSKMTKAQLLKAIRNAEDIGGLREWYNIPRASDEKLLETTLRRRGVGALLDKEIEPIIGDLADAGFITSESCTGGPKHQMRTGYITIAADTVSGKSDLTTIQNIIRQHTSTPFQIHRGPYTSRDIDGNTFDSNIYVVKFVGPVRNK